MLTGILLSDVLVFSSGQQHLKSPEQYIKESERVKRSTEALFL